MARLPLDKMAAQLEDIAKDITGEYERKKVYPWDRIADATATIAEAVGAEVPDKKYSTKKAQVADTINAISDANVSGLDGYKLIDGSYSGENGEIVIPAGKINSIGYYGLAGTQATKIDLKDSGITTIDTGGLAGNSNLTEIVFPDDLEVIRGFCFTGCYNITDISFGTNVTIGFHTTFAGCTNLVSVPILTCPKEAGQTYMKDTFSGCGNLKKVIITNATSISSDAFSGCLSLEYLYIGPTVTQINSGAFGGVPVTCKVRCGFSEGAISGFPANGGWAGNPNNLDIEYDVPVPTEYPED